MTINKVPLAELQGRMTRFRAEMTAASPDWQLAIFISKINFYYFTGTVQDGLLIIPRDEPATCWVRRSYERACDESAFPRIRPMESFRDAARSMKKIPRVAHVETEVMPLAFYQRLRKHFPFEDVQSADAQIGAVRALKSPCELALMEQAGEIHRRVLEEEVPKMLREGMSEAELGAALFPVMIAAGHHGVSRFGMFDTDMVVGYIGFGESSIYPTYLNGPGGNRGLSPAVPIFGSRERKLKKGDLVSIDTGCCVEGYHTDKTQSYLFGQALSAEAMAADARCAEIQDQVAAMLKPGAIPSEIYARVMKGLSSAFLENFMGFGNRRVRFLGHGVGLLIDEVPVIAEGFNEPLQEGMALAIEPKKGVKDIGMAGTENTFFVTPAGGRSITGSSRRAIPVF